MSIPIHAFRPIVLCFQGRSNVCVHPKGPECVVEIENEELGKRLSVCECFWGLQIGETAEYGCRTLLADHDGVVEEGQKDQGEEGQGERGEQ